MITASLGYSTLAADSLSAPAVDDAGKRTMYRRAQYLFIQWALQHDVDINHFSSADLINFSADTYADLYSCNTLHIFRSAILHLQVNPQFICTLFPKINVAAICRLGI